LSLIDKDEINNAMLYGDDNESRDPKKKPKKKIMKLIYKVKITSVEKKV